jgi:cobalamin biosynthesis Mg chelatase CobN
MRNKIVLIAGAACMFATGCGSVKKISHKLTTRADSSMSIKRDTSSEVRKDSASRLVDKSFVITNEHIVTETSTPGINISRDFYLKDIFLAPSLFISPDGSTLLQLSFNAKDSTIKAQVTQKPTATKQTTDRQTRSHNDLVTDSKASSSEKKSGSATIAKSASKEVIQVDTSKEVKRPLLPWPVAVVIAILAVLALIYVVYRKIKNKILI